MILKITFEVDLSELNSQGTAPLSATCHKSQSAQPNTSPSGESPLIPQSTDDAEYLAQSVVEHDGTDQERGIDEINNAKKEIHPGQAILDSEGFWRQLGGSQMQESVSGASDSPFIETKVDPRFPFPGIHHTQTNQYNKRQPIQNKEAEGSNKRRHH
ncbi:uncharacterized protein MELLADRAFT_112535 [Melampsora larici-populina 98AG31]|uniref:Uncharacterized protein n=1 Tax=Melampsora larici-populina (strain 98AG31 / pathotype 3-4-7) TaxID=747676 RepID=F4S6T4_MELLP|nr:uncharacterized protein MELLADRAFT_112535 [Melampsora larici-populina 98AG31]EGF99626.1 hypothetical protein MELLADRAFT_112535 [Melampsora larici-populina 98AG31]